MHVKTTKREIAIAVIIVAGSVGFGFAMLTALWFSIFVFNASSRTIEALQGLLTVMAYLLPEGAFAVLSDAQCFWLACTLTVFGWAVVFASFVALSLRCTSFNRPRYSSPN